MDQVAYMDILKQAIVNEYEAYIFYCQAAEKVADTKIKKFFEGIAKDELGHKALLENYANDLSETLHFNAAHDYQVSETVDAPTLSTEMSFKEAVALSMKKEQEAVDMYTAFANACVEGAPKKVFAELAKMEAEHKAGLEEVYTNVAFVEAW